ncbi:hypothetical protein ABZ916_25860 [Streptomyces sp. NPDC046853]|uniref:hypothetical protein n=1 Tax=Streptomyces sp. NPDC046853 TaxID=3154920 RepID=UPI0033DF41EA
MEQHPLRGESENMHDRGHLAHARPSLEAWQGSRGKEEMKLKRGQAVFDRSELGRTKVFFHRVTAHGLIEIKDFNGLKGFINPDDVRKWEHA